MGGVAVYSGAKSDVGGGMGGGPFGPRRCRSIGAELHFAFQDGARAAGVHYEQNEIRGLSAKLQTKAAAFQSHHRRGAPRAGEMLTSAAAHGAAAVTCAKDKGSLDDRRKDND